VLVTGAVLGVAAISSDADQHKGGGAQDRAEDQSQVGMQDQDKDRLRDKERIRLRDPSSLKDDEIYGHKLMSAEELNQYRERLRLLKSEEERLKFEAQHREEMQERAKALHIEIEDAE
jgi:uncharacterized small protein (DUF1192 family)